MTDSLYYVQDSPVHGLGLFAKEFIPAGTIWWAGSREDLIEITQHQYNLLLNSVYSRMLGEIREHCYYDRSLDRLLFICNDGRYINHSNNPNCAMHGGFLMSITTRDVQAHEELFEDYRTYDICPWANLWGGLGIQLGVWKRGDVCL